MKKPLLRQALLKALASKAMDFREMEAATGERFDRYDSYRVLLKLVDEGMAEKVGADKWQLTQEARSLLW